MIQSRHLRRNTHWTVCSPKKTYKKSRKKRRQYSQGCRQVCRYQPRPPPADLAKDLEYPTAIDTDYNAIPPPVFADSVNARTILPCKMAIINTHISALRKKAEAGQITISDAVNLAIHEEMLRDPSTTSNFTTSSLMFD